MSAGEERVLRQLCASIAAGTHVGADEHERTYELPITYQDGSSIELAVRTDDVITDGGRTILRFLAEHRLGDLEVWEGLSWFLRIHKMAREKNEFVLVGRPEVDLIHFLQGVRDLEIAVPRTRERSTAFDDIVRSAVEAELETAVDKGRISEDVRDFILNPRYRAQIRSPETQDLIDVPITADYIRRDGKELVVVLSHGGDTVTSRINHIRIKLAEHALLRGNRNAPRTIAVVPRDSFYGEQEENLIVALAGHSPLRVGQKDAGKKLAHRLLTTDGPFSR